MKWRRVRRNLWLGLFVPGLLLVAMQELLYITQPLLYLQENPLMAMENAYPALNILEKILGIGTLLSMLLIVNETTGRFLIAAEREKILFGFVLFFLVGYFNLEDTTDRRWFYRC